MHVLIQVGTAAAAAFAVVETSPEQEHGAILMHVGGWIHVVPSAWNSTSNAACHSAINPGDDMHRDT